MQRIFLEFSYSDKDIVDSIINSTPPEGVRVTIEPGARIEASAGSGGIYISIIIEFAHIVRDVSIGVLSSWLYDRLKKSGSKNCRVNNQQLIFNRRSIARLIKEEFLNEKRHHQKRRRNQRQSPKKRS